MLCIYTVCCMLLTWAVAVDAAVIHICIAYAVVYIAVIVGAGAVCVYAACWWRVLCCILIYGFKKQVASEHFQVIFNLSLLLKKKNCLMPTSEINELV